MTIEMSLSEWLFLFSGVIFLMLCGMVIGIKLFQKDNYISPEEIIECFKDVDWMVRSFNFAGAIAETSNGCKTFYCAPQIENAIKKLNKLIDSKKKN